MPPEERRQAILDAAIPLLCERGRAVTTKELAESAGIAEGTIFRVFATKDELYDAALRHVFAPDSFEEQIRAIDPDLPVEDRLLELTEIYQRRFVRIFTLMAALGLGRPPRWRHEPETEERAAKLMKMVTDVIGPDAERFRVPVEQVVHTLRLLTFSGSHPHISDQRLLTPFEIVDVVLHGTLRKDS